MVLSSVPMIPNNFIYIVHLSNDKPIPLMAFWSLAATLSGLKLPDGRIVGFGGAQSNQNH